MKSMGTIAAVVLTLSVIPSVVQLKRLGWSEWHIAQRGFLAVLGELPAETSRVEVDSCPKAGVPRSDFARVVGGLPAVWEAWRSIHPSRSIQVRIDCWGDDPPSGSPAVRLKWDFPKTHWVNAP